MSKANTVYVLMIVIFAAGLWTILTFGSIVLRAPADLSGKWELYAITAEAGGDPAHQMVVEQSGLYARVGIDGWFTSVKRSTPAADVNDPPTHVAITMAGKELEMLFQGRRNRDEFVLKTSGHLTGTWRAVRTARSYRTRPSDLPATRPTVAHARL